ncbi:hypothetical protein L917_20731 [Phytophthora nicotianae]|uniref:Uncharacterized protein n=1 Tax=Phytophthora nicotianae TaxID=4792 RepID=W2JZW7_PHYNI|nr:hypothetical protein L917_20731 [Phytophthora nicotianae]
MQIYRSSRKLRRVARRRRPGTGGAVSHDPSQTDTTLEPSCR